MTEKALALSREIYFDNRRSRLFIKEGQEAPKNCKINIERGVDNKQQHTRKNTENSSHGLRKLSFSIDNCNV